MAKKLTGDSWIQHIVEKSRPFVFEPEELHLISKVIDIIYSLEPLDAARRKIFLAAAFDLVIAADYYRSVAHTNWLYCSEPKSAPFLFYTYVNGCPRCLLKNRFVHTKAHKPKSGVIGAKTSRLLCLILDNLFKRNNHSISILKGVEPVDMVLQDSTSNPEIIMFGEIKAAPLVTLPLVVPSQLLTSEQEEKVVEIDHTVVSIPQLYGQEISILIPVFEESKRWSYKTFPLGTKNNASDTSWAFQGFLYLLERQPEFIEAYLRFWEKALIQYGNKNQHAIFWLLNASGQPSPRPNDWPRVSGGRGFESLSDSKTSVGMDRTDDLKKGTYQILKISADGKPSEKYEYKVGMFSNIHAIRHFDGYLDSLKDIIWSRNEVSAVRVAADLPPELPVFNLFDGIVTLTDTFTKDDWIAKMFSF